MKKTALLRFSLLAACAAGALNSSFAVVTPPVGAINIPLTAGSDHFVSVVFENSAEFQGQVDSISDIGSGIYQIGVSIPSGAADAYANLYHVRFLSGDAAGKYFTITASSGTTLNIDSIGDDLSGVVATDSFKVVRYNTLGSVFPPDTQTALVASTNNFPAGRGSEVLIPDLAGSGTNRSPASIYFLDSTNWKNASGFGISNDVIIYPDSYIIIRQDADAGARSLTMFGSVLESTSVIYLATDTSDLDNYVAISRPVDYTLSELGLESAFTESSNNFPSGRQDELLVYIGATGTNPSPTAIYFRQGGVWKNASGFAVSDDVVIPASAALVIRKNGSSPSTVEWHNPINW
jgi:uncharacterized protein (TIGR02597 family)